MLGAWVCLELLGTAVLVGGSVMFVGLKDLGRLNLGHFRGRS